VIFNIKGRAGHVSRQELRALLHATCTILSYHNIKLLTPADTICVRLVAMFEDNSAGKAFLERNEICLLAGLPYSQMATVVIHELIHLHVSYEASEEKLTSTLTGKIKDDAIRLANVLAENTQKRAAYFAHTKISYKPADGSDFYDQEQYHINHADSTAAKYRRSI
jgi:hypothetical protein